MRISTRSGPNSETKGASSDALDGSGASRVPRRASVRMLSLTLGFARKVCWSVAILVGQSGGSWLRGGGRTERTSSFSDLPMYNVDKKMRLSAVLILSFSVS